MLQSRSKRTDFDEDDTGLKFEPEDSQKDAVLRQPDTNNGPGPASFKTEGGGREEGLNQLQAKVYGPKAVYKAGILGNFEPNIPPVKGPGVYNHII